MLPTFPLLRGGANIAVGLNFCFELVVLVTGAAAARLLRAAGSDSGRAWAGRLLLGCWLLSALDWLLSGPLLFGALLAARSVSI